MLQTFQDKGCLFHMGKDALAPNQTLWIQISESFVQEKKFVRHSICLKAAQQTWSHKKETQKEGLQHWPLTPEPESSPEHMRETEGSGAQRLPWALAVKQLQSLGASKLSSGLGAAERDLDSLKLSIISQDYQE